MCPNTRLTQRFRRDPADQPGCTVFAAYRDGSCRYISVGAEADPLEHNRVGSGA
jgi:hypothetical protein